VWGGVVTGLMWGVGVAEVGGGHGGVLWQLGQCEQLCREPLCPSVETSRVVKFPQYSLSGTGYESSLSVRCLKSAL
jgi:hypothetical protein